MRIRVKGVWSEGADEMSGPAVITVSDGRIVEVSSEDADAEIVLDAYALPGLVDCHEHIGLNVGDERRQSLDDARRMAVRGVEALRTMLHAGVTTIRDCGERADVEPYWIEALDSGVITGPRVVRSVTPICRTGGHAWYLGAQVDGLDAGRAAVRRNVREGADFIKVMASGGIGTVGSVASAPEFTDAELHAIVEEAHRLGRKVAAHGHGGPGVDQALDAGVDSIEHGVLLTDDQLERMAQLGTHLVVTMGIARAFSESSDLPASVRAHATETLQGYRDRLGKAKRMGVRVALGSDCVHGGVAAEAGYLVEAGFTAIEALTAATASGADLVGLADIGRIAAGAQADLLFVGADPTVDIHALKRPAAVLKSGEWVALVADSPLLASL